MNSHAEQTPENKSKAVANGSVNQNIGKAFSFEHEDKRPEIAAQRKLQESVNNSVQVKHLNTIQAMVNNHASQTGQLKQMNAVPVLQKKAVVQLKLNQDDAHALYQYYLQHYANVVPWAIWQPYHANIVESNVDLAEAEQDVDRQIAILPPAAAAVVADGGDAAPAGEVAAAEADVDIAPAATAAPAAARPSFASMAAALGAGRPAGAGIPRIAMAAPVRAAAAAPGPAVAVAAAAPAAAAAAATPADIFQAAAPARFVISGGKRRTLAGTLWFKVLYGDRDYSLHIHVDATGKIKHSDDKIKNRAGQEYFVRLSSAANAAVKALNPFP